MKRLIEECPFLSSFTFLDENYYVLPMTKGQKDAIKRSEVKVASLDSGKEMSIPFGTMVTSHFNTPWEEMNLK
jgi:hypothetical protein